MRLGLIFIFTLFCVVLQAQSELISRTWVPQKTDSTWMIFALEDSLQTPVRVDSVVIVSFGELYEMGLITINDGKYGLFSSVTEEHQLKHEYDSMFVSNDLLLFKKQGSWSYCRALDFIESSGKSFPTKVLGNVDSFFVNSEGVFYWLNGFQGLISMQYHITPTYKYVRLYHKSEGKISFLVSNGQEVGLLKGEKEVLPIRYEAIELYDYGWYRFWIRQNDSLGYWNYLTPNDRVIQTNGFDFRVYSREFYKIYNSDRTQSRFFKDQKELSFGYDDYFYLGGDFLAVRKNDKIGLINTSGKVFFSPQYDQIEILDKHRLRVLIKDAWYLADYNGKVLSETGFGTIVHFQFLKGKSDFLLDNTLNYAVNSRNGMGIMNDEGKVIVAPNYSQISKMGDFFVANNGTNVVYNKFGKRVSDKVYPEYGKSFDEFIVMKTAEGTFDILSTEGKVNNRSFEHFVKYNGAFKCYNKTGFEIIVMSDELPAHVEEIQSFTLDNTVAVEYLDTLKSWTLLWEVNDAELEETQKTGYWNLRESKTTKNSNSNWIDVIDGVLGSTEILAVSSYGSRKIQMPFGPEMNVYFEGVQLSFSSFYFPTSRLVSTSSTRPFFAERSGWDNLDLYADGTQHWHGPSNIVANIDPNKIFSLDHCLHSGFAATLAEKAEITTTAESEFDLFSWWETKNDFQNIHPNRSSLAQVMNPKLKLIPENTTVVLRSDKSRIDRPRTALLDNTQYDEFSFLSGFWNFDRRIFMAKKFNNDTLYWFDYSRDSAVNKNYSNAIISEDEFAITESIQPHFGFSHPSDLTYVFDPDDSLSWNKTFVYDRILVRENDSFRIEETDGSILFSARGNAEPINDGLFYISGESKALIVDRDGEVLHELPLGNLIRCEDRSMLIQTSDSIYWYSGTFQKLNVVPTGKLSSVLGDHWLIERTDERNIYSPTGSFLTALFEGETITLNGWLMNKTEKSFDYRLPSEKTTLHFNVKPEESNYLLFSKMKDYHVVYDSKGTLRLTKTEKMTSKREKGSYTIFNNKKAFVVLDEFGNRLYEGSKFKSVEELDGVLFVELSDTVLQLKTAAKEVSPSRKETEIASPWRLGVEHKVPLPRKKGAAFYYGQTIVPAIYDNVYVVGQRFLIVQSGNAFLTYEVGVGFVRAPLPVN